MKKLKVRTIFVSVFMAALALSLFAAVAACSGGEKDSSGNYGRGEEGVYYYDSDLSTEYIMTLQSGVYMISMDGASGYSGTYSYDDESKSVSFVASDGDAFEASFSDDVMQLEIEDTPYTFLKRVNCTVTFVDGSSRTTESVVYGKSAAAPETDSSRIFIGWYEDTDFSTRYKFDRAVTGDLTLYAYYIDVDATIANYGVTFILDGTAVYETKTQNGVIYDVPDLEGVLGWWISATGDPDALTYKYNGETLTESEKLFAVKEGSLGASVYDNKVTWEGSSSSVTITVDGTLVTSNGANGSYAYDFSSLPTGIHEILVSAQGYGDETLVYVANRLDRVSNFSVYGTTLVYNAVENAQYYKISVTCGNPSHDHTMVYNGSTLTYDFSNCEMGPYGISFTVYAYAQGYVESVSETYVYALILDGTAVTIDKTTDTATWTAVSGASGYEVYINGEYAATTTDTEYSLKYYDIEDKIAVSVKPVAPGYWSGESAATEYTKATLRAPEITGINEYTVSWTEIEEATNYIICVNGKQVETVGSDITSYALATDEDFVKADSYVITIKAVNDKNVSQNSQESDAVYATDDAMSELLVYEDGVVYWRYAMAAGTYFVTVNDENETAVEGRNFFDVTFTQSGENIIKVWFTTENGQSALATLSVTAYAVIFDSRGGNSIDTLYVAKGDTISLPVPVYEAGEANFDGWYTLPDLAGDYDSLTYMGDGVIFEDGSTFKGNSTLILYAGWLSVKYTAFLDPGMGELIDTDGLPVESTLIAKNSTTFTLPVPTSDDVTYVFYGWYSGADGTGTRYTDENGHAVRAYNADGEITLHAYWVQVVALSLTTYGGQRVLSASKGDGISLVSEVTVPDTYVVDGAEYTVAVLGATAFNSCSNLVTINLPDTIQYVGTTNNGYSSGTGVFASSANIENVNIYPTEGNHERFYYSDDGVLFRKLSSDGVELVYYPYGRRAASYSVPEIVSNEYEYGYAGTEEAAVTRGVTAIATRVFYNHGELERLSVPATMEDIESEAFYNCSSLVSVTFGLSAAEVSLRIGDKAFRNCSALTAITLPSRLVDFDNGIFTGCSSLAYVDVSGGSGNYTARDGILCDSTGRKIIFCPVAWSGPFTMSGTWGVMEIGESAFEKCTLITEVTISANVTEIGENAFYGCTGMTQITFDDADRNGAGLAIRTGAFDGCSNSSLTEVRLPSRLVYLAEASFANCSKLVTVYYDSWEGTATEDLDGLQPYAFCKSASSRTGYVTKIVLGKNVPLIDFVAIFGGTKLQTVEIDPDNPNYSTGAEGRLVYDAEKSTVLYCAYAATGTITLEDSVTSISDDAFYGCANITCVVLNDGIESVGARAFSGCASLVEINFPDGLVSVGSEAFYGCTSLLSVFLPASLVYLGEYDSNGNLVSMDVFNGCTALESVTVAEGNPVFMSDLGVLYLADMRTVTVTDGDGDAVTETRLVPTELLFCPLDNAVSDLVIPSTVTKIQSNAFKGNTGVVRVSFDGTIDGTLEIGDGAFQSAVSLETIELPKGLVSIGDSLFKSCSSLKNVIIPYTVESVGAQAFYQCEVLEYVYFESADPELGEREVPLSFGDGISESTGATFGYTSNLIYVNIPDRTTEICAYMFYHSGVQSVVIGAGVESLPRETFGYVTNLQSVRFGEHEDSDVQLKYFLSYSDKSVFDHADGNFELILPEGFLEFGGYDFCYCDGLTRIFIPKTTQQFGDMMFYYAHNLEEIVFEDGIGTDEYMKGASGKGIDFTYSMMFSNCTSLKRIDVPASVTKFDGLTFDSCTSLEEVNFLVDESGYSSLAEMQRFEFSNTALTSFTFPETDPARSDGGKISFTESQYGCLFRWCDSFTEVTLSNGVQDGLDYVLGEAVHLTTVNIGTCWAYALEGGILYSTQTGEIAKVVGEVKGDLLIPYNITKIGDYAFQYAVSLTSVSFPTTIESVGRYAFDGCKALESVTFYEPADEYGLVPSETVTFGKDCFRNCTSLKYVEMAESVVEFGTSLSDDGNIFEGCVSLEKVILSSKTVRLSAYMFYNCTSLAVVTYNGDASYSTFADYSVTGYMNLPSTIRFLGNYCFGGSGLITAYVPATVTGTSTSSSATSAFGTNMFNGCERLVTVRFEEGADTLNTYAFASCTSLVSIILPDTITSVPNYCFKGAGLETFTLSSAVTSLGTYCFQNCPDLVSVTIPEGTKITSLGNYTFDGCTSLKSMVIPEGVTTLGQYLFRGCTALENVTVPASITTLNTYLFQNCSSLKNITFAAVENGKITSTSLSNYTFYGCSSLETVVLPTNFKTFGTYVFYGCTSLKKLDVSGITSFGNYCFYGCTSLESLDLSSVTSYGNYCFYECSSLRNAELSDSVSSIGTYMFYGCTSLEHVVLGGTYTSLTTYMFYGCTSLGYIDLPDRLIYLGTYTFMGCTALEEVTLPSSLTALGSASGTYTVTALAHTFDGCTALKKVVLNSDIKAIAGYAFYGCANLKIVTYSGDPDYDGDKEFMYEETGYFALPSSLTAIGTYAFANSDLVAVTLPEFSAVTGNSYAVGDYAFFGCTSLLSVTYNRDSTVMGEYMFAGCTALTDFTFLGDYAEISIGAFQGCTCLEYISLPEHIENIGDYAFDGCTALYSVEMADTTVTIGAYAFRNCVSLETVELPLFLEEIGDCAFYGAGLTEITIPEYVVTMGISPFGGCTDLVSLTIDSANVNYTTIGSNMIVGADGTLIGVLPSLSGDVVITGGTVTAIADGAFIGATGIASVTLSGVTTIGANAFDGLSALTSVSLGDVETIAAYAFVGTGLTTVTIPSGVRTIGEHAFDGLTKLTTVTFASGSALETIEAYAFANTGLTAATIPSSVTSIGEYAFSGSSITSLNLGSEIETIGDYAFANCGALTTVAFDCVAVSMGDGLFSGCTNLGSVTFSSGVAIDVIADYMFYGCTSLTGINIPNSVTEIESYAFAGSGLTSLTLPANVIVIDGYAFYGCASLGTVTFGMGLVTIGDYAFAESGIKSVTLTSGVENIGNYVFADCTSLTSVDLSAATALSIGDYAFANDTAISKINILYENTVSIGEAAFAGWTEGQTIEIDSTYFLATRKWMRNAKSSTGESAQETWPDECNATFVYAE